MGQYFLFLWNHCFSFCDLVHAMERDYKWPMLTANVVAVAFVNIASIVVHNVATVAHIYVVAVIYGAAVAAINYVALNFAVVNAAAVAVINVAVGATPVKKYHSAVPGPRK